MLPTKLDNVLTKFETYKYNGSDWIVSCPCIYHGRGKGDKNPSLFISIGENGKIIFNCWSGCRTEDILTSIGLSYKDLILDEHLICLKDYIKSSSFKVRSPEEIEKFNKCYKKLLDSLTLNELHLDNLSHRGFSEEFIKGGEYKSLHRKDLPLITSLLKEKEYSDVPGFLDFESNSLCSGLLIPVRNINKDIVALKIRRFSDTGPKYIYFSGDKNSSRSPIHFPIDFELKRDLRITEGELKADICSQYKYIHKLETMSIPGITSWNKCIPFIESNKEIIKNIFLAFDFKDVVEKDNVRLQLRLFIEQLPKDINLFLETWDIEYKGIDDLLISGNYTVCIRGREKIIEYLDSLDKGSLVMEEDLIIKDIDYEKPLAEFPLEIFPDVVKDYILSVSKTTDAPVDFAALSALLITASAIGSSRKIRIKQRWLESPIIYAAIIANAGSAKSPSVNAMQRPIVIRQHKAMEDYAKVIPTKDKKVFPVEYYTTETTVAALTERLINNPKGLLISTDEILSWIKSFNSFSSSNDQQFYLTIWNGQPVKVDRKTGDRPVSFIRYPYVSVLGSIQPKRLPELYMEGRGDDGFLDRFLFTFPITKELPYWKFDDESMETSEDKDYFYWSSIINRLLDIPLESPIKFLELSSDARLYSINWYNKKLVDELRDPKFPDHLRGVWLKLKAYFFRFALVIELIKWASTSGEEIPREVSEDSCKKADLLCEYFKSHAIKVAKHSNPSFELLQIEEVKNILKAKGSICAKDLVSLGRYHLPKKIAEARSLLLTCQLYGIGIYYPEKDGIKDVLVGKL